MLIRLLIASCAVVVGVVCASPVSAQSSTPCPPVKTHGVLRKDDIILYSFEKNGPNIQGCSVSTGHSVGFPAVFPLPAIDIDGGVVGVASLQDDGEVIEAYDIKRLRSLRNVGVEGRRVGSLRVRSDGAVAWISCPGPQFYGYLLPVATPNCVRPGKAFNRVYLLTAKSRIPRLLDRGSYLDPRSLRRDGRLLTWRRNGKRHTYRLPRADG